MKTYELFLEATEKDIRAMGGSDKTIEELKRRKKKRGYGFDRDDDRAKTSTESPKNKVDSIKKALPGTAGGPLARRNTSPKNNLNSTQKALPGSTGGPLALRAADKGSAIVKQKKKYRGYMSAPDTEPGKVGGEGFGRRPPGHWGKTMSDEEKKKKRRKNRFKLKLKKPITGTESPGATSGSVGQQAQVTRHTGGTKHF